MCVQINVNGQTFCDFRHRLPKERVTHLVVVGDVTVQNILFAGAGVQTNLCRHLICYIVYFLKIFKQKFYFSGSNDTQNLQHFNDRLGKDSRRNTNQNIGRYFEKAVEYTHGKVKISC